MKKFARTISYLPLAGKIWIAPVVFGLYGATTNSRRTAWFCLALILLVLFIFAHGKQAQIGFEALHLDAPTWVRIIFGLFAVANACVTLTQIYILYRITVFLFTASLPRTKRSRPGFSLIEKLRMIGVTSVGMALFFVLYRAYK